MGLQKSTGSQVSRRGAERNLKLIFPVRQEYEQGYPRNPIKKKKIECCFDYCAGTVTLGWGGVNLKKGGIV